MNYASRDAAMGKGDDELFSKKMTKEEKKAAAKAARSAKKKAKEAKNPKKNSAKKELTEAELALADVKLAEQLANDNSQEAKNARALETLSDESIAVTYAATKRKPAATDKDINVSEVTVTFHGKALIEQTDIVINYGNR